jgi:hypothetical protein
VGKEQTPDGIASTTDRLKFMTIKTAASSTLNSMTECRDIAPKRGIKAASTLRVHKPLEASILNASLDDASELLAFFCALRRQWDGW